MYLNLSNTLLVGCDMLNEWEYSMSIDNIDTSLPHALTVTARLDWGRDVTVLKSVN